MAKFVATAGTEEVATALFKGFANIVEEYYPNANIRSFREYFFDFWKFIGHELFVMFVATLMREERWELISSLLDEPIVLTNGEIYRAEVITYKNISQRVDLLDTIRKRRLGLNCISVRSDQLDERHQDGDLAKLVSADEFMAADFFLFLKGEAKNNDLDNTFMFNLYTYSFIHLKNSGPRFLLEASSRKEASRLTAALGLGDVEALRNLVKGCKTLLSRVKRNIAGGWHSVLYYYDENSIASI